MKHLKQIRLKNKTRFCFDPVLLVRVKNVQLMQPGGKNTNNITSLTSVLVTCTYVCEAVEACKEFIQHSNQLLRRKRGGEVCEAFNICEKNAE